MLVISRRENEKFLFPNLGITVQLVKVAGKFARIGVDAPRHIRVLREELADNQVRSALADTLNALGEKLPQQLKHDFRNRLNPVSLGLQVAQKLVEQGDTERLAPVLDNLIDRLKKLDGDLLTGDVGTKKPTEKTSQFSLSDVLEDVELGEEKQALIVDDNANERSLMRTLLELSGYSVVMVEDGQAAIEYLQQTFQVPDFVLLDMNMPRKNGAETITEIRSNPEFKGLKVFAVSGSDQDDMNVSVGPQGVDRWFTKPLDARQLVGEMELELQSAG